MFFSAHSTAFGLCKKKKLGCRKLADICKIAKTAAANILKNEKKIREQHEMFCEKIKET